MTEIDTLGGERPERELSAHLESHAPPELAGLVFALARAAIPIAARIVRGPLAGAFDDESETAIEAFADEAFYRGLRGTAARAFVTEARETPPWVNPEGRFLVALDPIDAEASVEINVATGSLFSILEAPASGTAEAADCLQPGSRQLAAGMIVYGPHTAIVFTVGAGTHVATLDPRTGAFRMTSTHLEMPTGRAEIAINAANARHWPGPVRAYIEDCLMGETGPRVKDFEMRWTASLAAEAYRVLLRGGAYLYPDDARAGCAHGRIPLLFQANPIAMLVEQAGGLAIDGVNRILDVPPARLDARTPLIFGAADKVEQIRHYYVDGHRSAARAPLFGKRGLLRG